MVLLEMLIVRIADLFAVQQVRNQLKPLYKLAQTAHEMQIGEKRTLLGKQLSDTISQLNASQQSDEQAYADELAAREYERSVASRQNANELAMKLYEYQHQLEVEAAEQARWQAEFDAKYGDGSSSSGGGGRKKTTAPAAQKTVPATVSGTRKNQKEMIK